MKETFPNKPKVPAGMHGARTQGPTSRSVMDEAKCLAYSANSPGHPLRQRVHEMVLEAPRSPQGIDVAFFEIVCTRLLLASFIKHARLGRELSQAELIQAEADLGSLMQEEESLRRL